MPPKTEDNFNMSGSANSAPTPETKKRCCSPYFISAIILIALVSVFLIWQARMAGSEFDKSSQSIVNLPPNPIADWKTYTNNQGYEMMFPSGWTYLECFNGTQLMLYSNPQEKEICDEPHGISSDLNITGPIKSSSGFDSYKKEKITINNVEAYKFIVEIGDDPNQRQKINNILIESDGKIFNMDFKDDSEVVNQILSTFKFTK
jgi:hypothetical protein